MSARVFELTTDEAAEAFLAQDLSGLDFTQFKPVQFEFEQKTSQLNMRIPDRLLEAVKARAREQGIPYTRLIRQLLEREVSGGK